MIIFNGHSSDDLGVFVEHYPYRGIPVRKFEKVSVPGRNGDLIFPEDAYENIIQSYDIYLSAKGCKTNNAARNVANWLMQRGYKRLEDSYDPEIFRMAYYSGGSEIENYLNEFGRTTIEFNCMPQRWLKSGEKPISFSGSINLTNPTGFESKPLITLRGSGNVTMSVNGNAINIAGLSEYVTLDSEIMECYKGNENKNSSMTGKFPVLSDSNIIVLGTGITSAEIIPRWWAI